MMNILFGTFVGLVIGFLLGMMAMKDLAVQFAAGCYAAQIIADRKAEEENRKAGGTARHGAPESPPYQRPRRNPNERN